MGLLERLFISLSFVFCKIFKKCLNLQLVTNKSLVLFCIFKVFQYFHFSFFNFFLTHLTMHCLKCLFHMNNHIDLVTKYKIKTNYQFFSVVPVLRRTLKALSPRPSLKEGLNMECLSLCMSVVVFYSGHSLTNMNGPFKINRISLE